MTVDATVAAEFWSKVTRGQDDECWQWTGLRHNPHGYGQWYRGRKFYVAHRLAYELTHGPVPPRTHLFHTCNNRSCVNPSHLRVVTHPDPAALRGRPITAAEIAWAAGIWEGEGSCWPNARTVRRAGRSATVHASVSQRDPEQWVLQRFRHLFGGKIDLEHNDGSSDCLRWRVTGARARGFLMTIFTFLSPWRRQQVLAALTVSKPRTRRRSVCKRGHPLTDDNVIRGTYGRRQCRKCVDLMRHARESRRRTRRMPSPRR